MGAKRTMRVSAVGVIACLLAVVGCGSEDSGSQSAPQSSGESKVGTAKVVTLSAAEDAVRGELPDIPYWKGTTFQGVRISDDEICVNRTMTKESARLTGSERTTHVSVTIPAMILGEPLDGACGTPPPDTASKPNAFYLAMDDYALRLDDAISQVQAGDKGAIAKIATLDSLIKTRNDEWTLSTGEMWVGANLLDSAVTAALTAAKAGDVAELARQRGEVADARSQLAEDAVK